MIPRQDDTMMDATADHGEVRFSSDALPASERIELLREALTRTIAAVDIHPLDDVPLRCVGRVHAFEGLRMIAGETTGLRCRRGGRLLSDGNDDLVFHTNLSGFSVVSQAGRECRIDGGAAVLMTAGESGTHDFPKDGGRWLTLCIPRKRLPSLDGVPEDAVTRPISSRSEALRLLVDYIDLGFGQDRLASPQLRQVFATHVYDLVALAIGAAHDAAEVARGRGLRAARLNTAKGEIGRRLEERLAITDVADASA
jgi:hypothetical protein